MGWHPTVQWQGASKLLMQTCWIWQQGHNKTRRHMRGPQCGWAAECAVGCSAPDQDAGGHRGEDHHAGSADRGDW